MREHVGKLHVRRTAKKPAEVHPIQIEQGPMMRPPALDLAASAERLAPAKASRLRPENGVQHLDPQIVAIQTNARKLIPPTVPGSLPQGLGPKLDPNNPLSTLLSNQNPMALPDAPVVGDVRNLGKEMPVVDRMTPESAGPIDPQQALTALNPLNADAEKMNARAAFEDGATASPESAPESQTPEVGQDTPQQQPAAEAPQQQGAAPEGQDTEEGESEAALPEAEAQQPAADQPAQVPPPPAAEGNDAGTNGGQGQGGNAGGGQGGGNAGGGGIGGGPELTPFEQAPAALDTSASGPMVQSLGKQQPTAIVATLGNVPGQLSTAQQGDVEQAKTLLPEIEQPTGLGTDGIENKKEAKSELKEEQAPEIKAPSDGKKQEVKTEHKLPEGKSPADKIQTPSNEALKSPGSLGNAIRNLPEVDPSISTTAGPRPQVELTGDADPQHNQTAQVEADTSTTEASAKAQTETEKDFKEGEIMPAIEKETMKVQQELTAPEGWNGAGGAVLPQLDAQTAAALNSGITAQHQAQIDAELAKETQGKAEFDQKAQEEQQKGLDKIKEENEKVKQQQLDERAKGKQTIDGHREEWKAENDKVMQDFDTKSKAEREKVDGKIQSKVAETNTQIESEYAKAETEAKTKTEGAQKEIDAKKAEAEKKEQDKSWWDKVRDAVSDFFDALKKAVSAIFDALKKAVTAIIEAAKKLASQLIDFARDMIKGLISAFAEMLKAFVRLALAAFPELAERFCAMIDQAVEAIHKAIDPLAEALKAAVNMLLDAIGAAINFLLDAYAAIINAILSAIEFLAVGWIKIMEGIANLVKAAVQSPSHLMGQLSEELLGQDISKPLENEYLPSTDTAPNATVEQDQVAESAPVQVETEADNQEAATKFFEKPNYEKGDFEVPVLQNATLSPELNQQLSQMGDGEHEFDGGGEGIQGMKDSSSPPNDENANQQEAPVENKANSEEEKLAYSEGSATDSPAQVAASGNPNGDRFTPDANGKVGPFAGPWERVKYIGKMAWNGIKETAQKYKYAIIGGIAAAVALVLFSGGAILGAVPPLLAILGFADMAYNIGKYLGIYLTAGFAGQIAQGAAALARVIVIAAIELLFTLLFGGKAALKGIKNSVKGTTKAAVKGGAKGLAKNLGRKAKRAIKGLKGQAQSLKESLGKSWKMIKSGDGIRLSMNAIKATTVKVAKSMRDLGRQIGDQFGFKKFRITIRNRKWRLEGKMNPWVLLANGSIIQVDQSELPAGVKNGDRVNVNFGDKIGGQKVTYPEKAIVLEASDAYDLGRSKAIDDSWHIDDEATRVAAENKSFMRGDEYKTTTGVLENQLKRVDDIKNKIAKLEQNPKLSQQQRKELQDLKRQLEPINVDELDGFKGSRENGRLVPPGTKMTPELAHNVDHAQKVMNDLYRPDSKYGDGGPGHMMILEQAFGGEIAKAVVGGTKHYGKGGMYITALVQAAKNLERVGADKKIIQRMVGEIERIKEAMKWADEFAKAAKSGKTIINNLPSWIDEAKLLQELEVLRNAK